MPISLVTAAGLKTNYRLNIQPTDGSVGSTSQVGIFERFMGDVKGRGRFKFTPFYFYFFKYFLLSFSHISTAYMFGYHNASLYTIHILHY